MLGSLAALAALAVTGDVSEASPIEGGASNSGAAQGLGSVPGSHCFIYCSRLPLQELTDFLLLIPLEDTFFH